MSEISFIHKTHRRAKRLTLRVEADGSVVVTTPTRTPKLVAAKFVNQNIQWISAQQQRHESKPKPITDDSIQLFGISYQKKLEYSADKPIGVRIYNESLILNPTDSRAGEWGRSENKLLKEYLKATAERYIAPRTGQLSAVMEIDYNAISLKEQKTRWGSCSSKGNLNFNWRLVHYEPKIIDYVIIHELAHRKHMNHSKQFWDFVKRFDPEYSKHRGFLKRQGVAVG